MKEGIHRAALLQNYETSHSIDSSRVHLAMLGLNHSIQSASIWSLLVNGESIPLQLKEDFS